jgi:hypothetical protein
MLRSLIASALISMCVLSVAPAAQAEDPPFVEWTTLLPTLTEGYDPTSANECVAGKTQCVDKVIREMYKRFDPQADSCSHDAVFALAYLRTTEEYRRTIDDPTFFRETSWVNHYDAVFAKYYFRAADDYAAGRRSDVPAAWRIAYDASRDKRVSGSGNLYLGMNAHINRDLPYVLASIGLIRPDGSTRKDDHDKVNRFLNRVADTLIPEIAARFDPTADDGEIPGTTLDNMALFQVIPSWREGAWRNAERLLAARTESERAAVAKSIEDYAATMASTFVAQTSYRPPLTTSGPRDAWCAVHHG